MASSGNRRDRDGCLRFRQPYTSNDDMAENESSGGSRHAVVRKTQCQHQPSPYQCANRADSPSPPPAAPTVRRLLAFCSRICSGAESANGNLSAADNAKVSDVVLYPLKKKSAMREHDNEVSFPTTGDAQRAYLPESLPPNTAPTPSPARPAS